MAELAAPRRPWAERFLGALQFQDYRRLWTANVCAGAAHWALIVARGWLVLELTDSSAMVGLVTFSAMIPRVVVAPFAGLLADRMDRKRILAWTFGISVGLNLILATLAISELIQVWHLVVLSFVNGIFRGAQMPASGALLPNLVPRRYLLNAIALNSGTQHGSRLLGPLLTVPLMLTVGSAWAFLFCTTFYALGLSQVLRIRTSSRGVVRSEQGFLRNMAAGAVYVYHHPLLLSLFVLVGLHCSLTMAFESLLPLLARDKLGMGGEGFTYIMMAVGAGALISVLSLAAVQSDLARGRLLMILGMASGIAPLGLGLAPNLPLVLLAAMGMGASQAGFMVILHTIIQSIAPDSIRGRIAALRNMHISGLMAGFNLVNGSLAEVYSIGWILGIAGVAFTAIMAFSFLLVPLRRLYAAGVPALTAAQATA